MAKSTGQIISETWSDLLHNAPGPGTCYHLLPPFGEPVPGYRWMLDRVQTNSFGRSLTRLQVVRWNLSRLGPTRLDPARLR